MDLNFTQTLNLTDPTQTINVYVFNIDLVIILLAIIAFCQAFHVIRILSKEVLKWN